MTTPIGKKINMRLSELDWSQRDLVEQSGVSITCISKIITGTCKNRSPNISTLKKLAKALGFAPRDLLIFYE